jgi:hypothetical protein
MNVVVTNLDSTTTSYGFAPEHKERAIGFYTSAYWGGMIQGFTATFDNGDTVQVGGN